MYITGGVAASIVELRLAALCRLHRILSWWRHKLGEGKGDTKGKTVGKKSPRTYAVRQGFLVFPIGFPLRKENPSGDLLR